MKPVIDRITRLAAHESQAAQAHWAALNGRWAVARKARSLPELLRDQLDLLPDTAARLRRDHQTRVALLRG